MCSVVSGPYDSFRSLDPCDLFRSFRSIFLYITHIVLIHTLTHTHTHTQTQTHTHTHTLTLAHTHTHIIHLQKT